MAPANATASPPDLAALYVQLHQQDRSANQIDRGLALMASAFGTSQQQHDMLNYAQNLQPDDRAAMLGNIIKDQAAQTQLQEHNRFVAGAAGMATMLGVSPDQATWLAQNPDAMNDALKTHFENLSKTDLQKNLDAGAVAYQQANPNATPQDIAQWKSNMINMTVNPAAKEAAVTRAKDVQDFKDSALTDYTPVSSKLQLQQNIVNQLLDPAHLQDTIKAVQSTKPTTGALGSWMPTLGLGSQAVNNQAVLIEQLRNQLSAEQLSGVKNVRNQREFNALGQAVAGSLNQANSADQITKGLQAIQNQILDARATAELAAGHQLTGELIGHGNRDLLDKTNPFYNGGSEAQPAQVSSPDDIAKLAHGTPFTIPSGPHKGEIGYAQ